MGPSLNWASCYYRVSCTRWQGIVCSKVRRLCRLLVPKPLPPALFLLNRLLFFEEFVAKAEKSARAGYRRRRRDTGSGHRFHPRTRNTSTFRGPRRYGRRDCGFGRLGFNSGWPGFDSGRPGTAENRHADLASNGGEQSHHGSRLGECVVESAAPESFNPVLLCVLCEARAQKRRCLLVKCDPPGHGTLPNSELEQVAIIRMQFRAPESPEQQLAISN